MSRLLVIHHDTDILRYIAGLVNHHEFLAIDNLLTGVKYIAKIRPDAIIVGHDSKKQEGIRLLRYMRENQMKLPVVVIVSGGGGVDQPMLMKLGAKSVREHPVSAEELAEALDAAMTAHRLEGEGPPSISDEELRSNLSVLESKLNREMKCFAGRNQVFIQSFVLGGGMKTKPRIALKCRLRGEYGLNRDVYYEFIRDVCCERLHLCEAYRRFIAEQSIQNV